MSRTGSSPINIPAGVSTQLNGDVLKLKGSKGEIDVTLLPFTGVEINDNTLNIKPVSISKGSSKDAKPVYNNANWGTTRALISNAVKGVSEGFEKHLVLQGVGFRAQMQGKDLKLGLGLSHDVIHKMPSDVSARIEGERGSTSIIISGINKQRVGQVASEIKAYRKPEPYKGKGVHYKGEYLLRKEGKKK